MLAPVVYFRSLGSGAPPEVGFRSGEKGAVRRTRLKVPQRGSRLPEVWSWGRSQVPNRSCWRKSQRPTGFCDGLSGLMSGFSRVSPFGWFFHSFPFWFPLLFFYPFLSPLSLTNQAPMISIEGGTGTVSVLSLISEDIRCTRQVFVFILGYYKLRISAVPAGHYLLLAPVFE